MSDQPSGTSLEETELKVSEETDSKKVKKKTSVKELNQSLQAKVDQLNKTIHAYAYALAASQNSMRIFEKTKKMEVCSIYKDFILQLIQLHENTLGEERDSTTYFDELLLRRKVYEPDYDCYNPELHTLLAGTASPEKTLKVHKKGYLFDFKEDKGLLLRKAVVTFESAQ